MILVFLMLIGLLFLKKLKVELKPDISYQTVSIYISVRGAPSPVIPPNLRYLYFSQGAEY